MFLANDFMLLLSAGVLESPYFKLLLLFITLDIVLGISKAILLKQLNSEIGIKGLIKHTTVILISFCLASILRLAGQKELSLMLGFFYISEYALSIVENLHIIGIPFPEWVTDLIDTLERKGGKKKDV